eukprot:TRINITY_DN529_c0_g1_i1.p1 TRINITY_DN529_c0_g1~~TRINITY_DN529_c0_g1_i1.p1  ORF type:complete len:440 (+),score=86.08 TRINITY_DN529_c0_g1_i1:56-1375(+)
MKVLVALVLVSVVCVILSSVQSQTLTKKRGLVVVDNANIRNTHSRFFRLLEGNGYTLDFHQASGASVELAKYGEYQYDFLVLLAPRAEDFGSRLTVDSILNFIDDGNNVIVAVDSEPSTINREIATECGVEFGAEKNLVIDHHNFDSSDFDGDHTLIIADNVVKSVVTGSPSGPVLYRGIDQHLEENDLLTPVLLASQYAYGASPDDAVSEARSNSGARPVLISALQARNNARVLFSGSLDVFSDRFLSSKVSRSSSASGSASPQSGNEQLARDLLAWTLKERGVLRASNVTHHLVSETQPRDVYKVTDRIYYSIDIEEWNGKQWVPYAGNDVQLEFTMLDPYVRATLKNTGGSTFHTEFVVPDVYGIFTFRVKLEKSGYTNVLDERIVTVRPFKHNEYERFIVAAYPYYASAFSMMFGLFIFSFFFLYTKERPVTQKK